ncbi:MAG: flavoprotein, partial [Myxococcota bacterium]|nr:flavoprotein [Myxococcota bacterium]
MISLHDRRVLLAVSGGIAAYKTPELVRRLKDAGADVRVVLTAAGAKFVSKLALEVVSGHPVGTALWTTDSESQIVHTDLGKEVDLIV